MKVLAVDTALGACSAALMEDDRVLAHRVAVMERGHAETLAPMVEDIMREANIAFGAIDRLAVTTGPGTFTGQRVGLAFMRGLRMALQIPLVGVTTLAAMAAAAMDESELPLGAVLHDAKRGEVYFALASAKAMATEPQLLVLDDAVRAVAVAVKDTASAVTLAGTAAEAAHAALADTGIESRVSSIRQPDALWVARLARSAPPPSHVPQPLYLRPADARLPVGP